MSNLTTHPLVKLIICTLMLIACPSLHATLNHSKDTDEALFKAAFIYNFAKFTSWPASALAENSPLILCTIGKLEAGFDLKRLSGKIIKNRQVEIKSLNKNQSAKQCHMLYIAKSEKKRFKQIIKKIKGKSILTVSDLPEFVNNGGIIQFYREKGQTHLIINLDHAREASLELSSRLLILAEVIGKQAKP